MNALLKNALFHERWRFSAYLCWLLWNLAAMVGTKVDWMMTAGMICYATHWIIVEIKRKK